MSIGFAEIVVIAALVLIFLGPKRMPEVMRALGRAWAEIVRAKDSVIAPLQEELDETARSLRTPPMNEDGAAVKEEFSDGHM